MSKKYLPCPFCGSLHIKKENTKVKYFGHNKKYDIQIIKFVECLNCGATTPNIKTWNKRK